MNQMIIFSLGLAQLEEFSPELRNFFSFRIRLVLYHAGGRVNDYLHKYEDKKIAPAWGDFY